MSEAVASGAGQIPALVERLRTTDAKRRAVVAELERARQTRPAPPWREIERRLRTGLADWRARLTGDVAIARDAFRAMLPEPIRFTPCVERGYRAIRFAGRIRLEAMFGGAMVMNLASPPGVEPGFQP